MSVFLITELSGPRESFSWSSEMDGSEGARACPVDSWKLTTTQRIKRTDYPGAKQPSFQVLGSKLEAFTLSGNWLDRYNTDGYAEDMRRRMPDLVGRGNLCRFALDGISITGIVTGCEVDYRNRHDIGYTLSVEPSSEDRSPAAEPVDPTRMMKVGDLADRAIITTKGALDNDLSGFTRNADSPLNFAAPAMEQLRDLTVSMARTVDVAEGEELREPSRAIANAASQLRGMAGTAAAVVDGLSAVRSDIDCAAANGADVLRFEQQTRTLRYRMRQVVGVSEQSATALEQRATPDNVRLYRPFKGESLYRIARRFTGSPENWRTIADDNHLVSLEFTGDELLVIRNALDGVA